MNKELKNIVDLEKKIQKEIEDRTSELIDEMPFHCSTCNEKLEGSAVYSKQTKKAYCDAPSSCASEAAFETYKSKNNNDPSILYNLPIETLRELWKIGEFKPNFNQFKKSKKYLDLMKFKSKALGLCKTMKEIKYGKTEGKKIKTSNGMTLHLSKNFLNLNNKSNFLIPISINSSQIENGITLNNFYDEIIANPNELSNAYRQVAGKNKLLKGHKRAV